MLLFVSGSTLKIRSFHKLQPDSPVRHDSLFSKMKEELLRAVTQNLKLIHFHPALLLWTLIIMDTK